MIGSECSLARMQMTEIKSIRAMAKMSTLMENQQDTPEDICTATMLLLSSLSQPRMKSFYLLKALIVEHPLIVSPKQLSKGLLVVLVILTVSLIEAAELETTQ